ncbi:MAG: LEA type 2 family protein [Bacteroidales bacterium]|jgi:LEA14-like dessication related protein|nr:LEA type 2 family protein [Bacteroidales bacterium]
MKKTYTLIIIVSFFCVLSCNQLKNIVSEPTFKAQSFQISKINFENMDLLFKVRVDNPNSFTIPFPNIDWNLSINNNQFLKNTLTKNTTIAANSYTIVDIPVTINYKNLYSVIKSLANTTSDATYKMNVGLSIPLPVLENKRYEVDFAGTVPMLKEPSISFKEIKVNSMNLNKIDLNIVCELENKNNFSVLIDNFNYDLAINNVEWAKGNAKSNKTISANTKTTVPLNISVNSLSMIKEITEIISGNKSVNYSWSGNLNLQTDNQLLKNINLPFELKGNTNIKK